MNEKLIDTAMQIILNAGDARNYIKDALDATMSNQQKEANNHLEKAKKCIEKAHQYQTETIQKEAKGEVCEYSMLFTHAQDTLMTIYSELHFSEKMIMMYRVLDEKINSIR